MGDERTWAVYACRRVTPFTFDEELRGTFDSAREAEQYADDNSPNEAAAGALLVVRERSAP